MRKFGMAIDDDVIEDVLRHGTADIGEKIPNNHRSQALFSGAGNARKMIQ